MPRANYFDHACSEAGLTFRLVRSTWISAGQGDVAAKALISKWRHSWPKLVTVFNLMERMDQRQVASVVGQPKKAKRMSLLIKVRDQSNAKGVARPLDGGAPGLGKRR